MKNKLITGLMTLIMAFVLPSMALANDDAMSIKAQTGAWQFGNYSSNLLNDSFADFNFGAANGFDEPLLSGSITKQNFANDTALTVVGIPATTIGGTDNPFEIGNATILQEMADLLEDNATYGADDEYSYAAANYVLCDNIDMTGKDWTAISNFTGTFDGMPNETQYTIQNFKDYDEEATYKGIFADAIAATIKNLQVTAPIKAGNVWDGETKTEPTDKNITSAEELAWLAEQVNTNTNTFSGETWNLTGNIDLGGHEWTPIGGSYYFAGTFNGNGNEITGLSVTDETSYAGLFGSIASTAVVKDLTVEGTIDVKGNTSNCNSAIVVGFSYGTIENVTACGSVDATGASVAGITGRLLGTVTGCVNYADITSTATGDASVGGVVGSVLASSNYDAPNILNSKNYGEINASGKHVGGIVGDIDASNKDINVTNCANMGSVKGGRYIGGIVGYSGSSAKNTIISGCYNVANITCSGYNIGSIIGNVVSSTKVSNCAGLNEKIVSTNDGTEHLLFGDIDGADVANLTNNYYWYNMTYENITPNKDSMQALSYMKNRFAKCEIDANGEITNEQPISNWNEILGDYWTTSDANMPDGSPVPSHISSGDTSTGGGSGTTTGDSWSNHAADSLATENEISSAAELAYFAKQVNDGNMLNANVELTANIDLSAYEWVAIGGETHQFAGTFDGQENKITGLIINQEKEKYQGLFGYVSNANIQNVSVDGTIKGYENVGGIVGYSENSTIQNCTNNATINGNTNVGGIAGHSNVTSQDATATIANCVNNGDINGEGSYLGGIAGCNGVATGSTNTVTGCINIGDVKGGAKSEAVGGIVGNNLVAFNQQTATVSNSYNTGSVSGTKQVGGIVGLNKASGTSGATVVFAMVKDCYNTGFVTGADNVGGVVGENLANSDGAQAYTGSCYNTGNVSGINNVGGVGGYNFNDGMNAQIQNCVSLANSVTGTKDVGRAVGKNSEDGTVNSGYAWEGTNGTFDSNTTLNGTDLYYNSTKGFYLEDSDFNWSSICGDGWEMPSAGVNSQLPKLAGNANFPQNPIKNVDFVTVTFKALNSTETKFNIEIGGTLPENPNLTDTWGIVAANGAITEYTYDAKTTYNEDTTISEVVAEASISNVKYNTIENAVAAAEKQDDNVITLLANAEVDETLEITGTVILSLNGKNITGNGNFPVITIKSGGTLRLSANNAKIGEITSVDVEADGTLAMIGGKIGTVDMKGALEVSGTPIIENLKLADKKSIRITSELMKGASIKVDATSLKNFGDKMYVTSYSYRYSELVNYIHPITNNGVFASLVGISNGVGYEYNFVCVDQHQCEDTCPCDNAIVVYDEQTLYSAARFGGTYYLGNNFDVTKQINVDDDVNLCLNGHSIEYKGESGNLFNVGSNHNLNLYDGTGNNGSIIGNVNVDGIFNMYGGNVRHVTCNGTMNVQGKVIVDAVNVANNGKINVTGNLDTAARIGIENTSGTIGTAKTTATISNDNFYVVGYKAQDVATPKLNDTIKDVAVGNDVTRLNEVQVYNLYVADFIYKTGVKMEGSMEDTDLISEDMWLEILTSDADFSTRPDDIKDANWKNAGFYILNGEYATALTIDKTVYLHLNSNTFSSNITTSGNTDLEVFDDGVGKITGDINLAAGRNITSFGGEISGAISGAKSSFPEKMSSLNLYGTFTGTIGADTELFVGYSAQLGTQTKPYVFDGKAIQYDSEYVPLDANAKFYIDLTNAKNGDVLATDYSNAEADNFSSHCTFSGGKFATSYDQGKITLQGVNVDEAGNIIYANGLPLVIVDGTANNGNITSTVFWDVNNDGTYDIDDIYIKENIDMSAWTIYGGKKDADVAYSLISIKGGNVGTVWAGGHDSDNTDDDGNVTSAGVVVEGDCTTDINMQNVKNIFMLRVEDGNLTGEITTDDNTTGDLACKNATVTVNAGDKYQNVLNVDSTINWTGGAIATLTVGGGTTNLSFNPTTQTNVYVYNSNGAVNSVTEAYKFITLTENVDYDDTDFILKYQDTTVDAQIVKIGSDLYFAPKFTAKITLAAGTTFDMETTATVTTSAMDFGENVFANKATIYVKNDDDNGDDFKVGEINLVNGKTTYNNVKINLLDTNIDGIPEYECVLVGVYIVYDLIDNASVKDTTVTTTSTNYKAVDKKVIDLTITGTDTIYDGNKQEISFTESTSLELTDFDVKYYEVDTEAEVLASTDEVEPNAQGKYLYVISLKDGAYSNNADKNASYFYEFEKEFTLNGTTLPDETHTNAGYLTIAPFTFTMTGSGKATELNITLSKALAGLNATNFTVKDDTTPVTVTVVENSDTSYTLSGEFKLGTTYTVFLDCKNDNITNPTDITVTPRVISSGGGSVKHDVAISDNNNGTVSTQKDSYKAGDDVTLVITPDKGYVVDKVVVKDEKGNELKLDGDSFKMPKGEVEIIVTFKKETEEVQFSDVDNDAYYYNPIKWAVANGITKGFEDGTFGPNIVSDRAQTVTFLWRAAGSPKSTIDNPFVDMSKNAYYYEAVLWAVENGITNGMTATTFEPNTMVSRGHIVTFMWRMAGKAENSGNAGFADVATNEYYYDAVKWAVGNQVTNGTSSTTFEPSSDCTRGQIVTFLYRYMAD